MKTRHLLVAGLIASLALTAARAAVYPYAEYHLGEAGSLGGTQKLPQDSSGAGRHFLASSSGQYANLSGSVAPAAIGSTASLDTTTSPGDPFWTGGGLSFSTLPKNNFAFGIFARTHGAPYGTAPVFSLGDNERAFAIFLDGSKWQLRSYHASGNLGVEESFVPNVWAHLAVIRNGGVTRFYVNGVDQGSPFTDEPVHGSPLLLKNFTGELNLNYEGLIDEARVVTFTEGETDANIITALQTGVGPSAFVNVGSNASFPRANLSPAEASVFRIGGAVQDSVQILEAGGLQVAGTAPQKHVIQIVREGALANGRYPLIAFSGTIGGQGLAGLELADIPGRVTGSLEINAENSTIDLVISGAEGITWTGAASVLWNKQDTNWVLGGTSTATQFLDADDVKFDDSSAATVNTITVEEGMLPASMTVDASENYSFSGVGIGLNGTLMKKGTGTLTLASGFTGSGPIAIQGGTLSVGDGGASGSLGTGPIALSGGQLLVNRSGDVSLPNPISGTGGIGKLGAGSLILSGTTAYSGPVTLAAGPIAAGRSNLFPGGVTIAAGASLDFKGFHPGAGTLTLNGSGANGEGAILNSGPSILLQGTHQLGSDASIGGGFGIKDMGPVTYYDPFPQSFPCYLSGNYKLTKVGSGTFSFFKTTVTVKDIVIEGGSFLADHFSTINNTYPGTITIHSGGSLDFGSTFLVLDQSVTPATCAKPIVFNGGTISASGGPFHGLSLPGGIELNGPGGTLIAERFISYMTSNGPLPTANISVGGVVSGSGSLIVGGSGIVSLAQAPAYTGDTTILAQPGNGYLRGRLSLAAPGLADTSTVSIADGAFLDLGFSGTDTVRRLFINGVQQQPGVYGSSHISGRILGSGTLTVTEGPAAPPYQLWADAHGIAGADAGADSDGDGIRNGIEFVLGGNPLGPDSNSNALLPVITRNGNTLNFIYRRTDASSANYAMRVEITTNPATNDWAPAPDYFTDPKILVENDAFGPGVDKVTVSIAMAGPKLFARLKVDVP